ncbi:prepilin-type N-terminal cleavage/methylation domain-containing protein [Cytobacillus depressus]|uniref:Prepilin-type N-terminal cleavage/methylation domain-containing protein n=1 Tax=Cytobacillus depressus TaxID=1602942 RepID=A0A6L3VAM9_9BACI|nr:prepilin-type N-terminal cleavage/methylation domain-containing protein [Cytobacillus depressus]KAB2338726.1 prepilin-type N-terminal cleavage/methylation domain-containing protein [Cytobacillus depressus]
MYEQNQKGLTLIEVLLSIVILSIILGTFIKFFPQMGLINKQNETKQQAVNLAKKELMYWKNVIETSNDFNVFRKNNNLTQSFSFINKTKGDTVTINIDTITIKTLSTNASDSKFGVQVKINKKSDLTTEPIKAYPIHIKLLKEGNEANPYSETYGYIFYQGD